MEQPAFYHLCLLLALLLLPLVLLRQLRKHDGDGDGGVRVRVRLPPGPWRLPVIGSLHHLVGRPLVHRAFADLARRMDAPLMYLKLGEVPVVVVTSRDAACEVMRAHDVTFATRPWSPTMRIMMEDGQGLAFSPYGDLWRQLRKICILELLSAHRVQSFRRVREDEVARLVAAVAAAPNVSRRIAVLLADSAVRAMIGDRFSRRDEFLASLQEGIKLVSGFSLGDLFPSSPLVSFLSGTARRAHANHRKNFELMECAIKQHEERRAVAAANGTDLDERRTRTWWTVQKEGGLDVPLTMGIIKAVILAPGWPDVMKKAQAELRGTLNGKPRVTEDDLAQMKYLKLIIKETLRLHPPAPLLLPREARESCKVLGYDVPKGTTVFVNAWAIGRDPRYWDDPEEFEPERFESGTIDFKGMDFEFIPFGAGRRICPGMMFAQSNIELALAALLYHFDWELTDGLKPSELDMSEDIGITVRRKNSLLLHPIVRVPLLSAQ
ncbi:hypothetical protein PVAP13_1NG081700 [Panicum virgatum]|uniref:Uncharacterized protein n=1 Tax=Panicum virgatum TaxID=38727 RepID=A0A8T0WLW6_PANVG|nr:hypothetical protein PVAP13_1NG081700 [Panicum virgatum]